MDEDPILVTERHIGEAIFRLVCSVGILAACVYFVYVGLTRDEYVQLVPLLLAVFFSLFVLAMLVDLRRRRTLKLFEDRLEIISVLGTVKKVIPRDAITAWSEYVFRNDTKYLTLFEGNISYKFKNTNFGDYDFLKSELTKNKPEVEAQLNKVPLFIVAWATVLVGCIVLAFSYNQYLKKDRRLQQQDMVTVGGMIVNPVEISRTTGRGAHSYVQIRLSTCPQFLFSIEYEAYHVMNRQGYLDHVMRGDSLYLDILADDYQKKISKERSLGFFDKTINYRDISVYGLRNSSSSFLTIDDYNKVDKLNRNFYEPGIFGLFLCLFGIGLVVSISLRKNANTV